ncbi:ribonuclease inhibitor [Galactobacter caseinivorans]|uniref:Ribonuclease inhibitor n=1 Tax=Galactobacter caseinivorans TaxID=2676123 RepID=A0A496PGF4_9MICC|nr:ribonuclease inhibitor [Galactobacter caseinivorans]
MIQGAQVAGIADFYAELNRLLMQDEDWEVGPSLDALNDLLYGGIGALVNVERPRFVWRDHAASRAALGVPATEEWLLSKLTSPAGFDQQGIRVQLAALRAGEGPSYFDLILEVFAEHPEVELVLE